MLLLLLLVLFLARVVELIEGDFFLKDLKGVWFFIGEVIDYRIISLGLDNNGLRVSRGSQIFNRHILLHWLWLMRVLLEQR